MTNLGAPVEHWVCGGVSITSMCHMERRHGKMKPVIEKALVDLHGVPFKVFTEQRNDWAQLDLYRSPGPIQFFEPSERACVRLCITLSLELFGSDSRMDIGVVAAAKFQQSSAPNFGHFIQHRALVGVASEVYSELTRNRNAFVPPLCPSFTQEPSVIMGSETQCRVTAQRSLISAMFPLTYGQPFATIETPTKHNLHSRINSAFSAGYSDSVKSEVGGRRAPLRIGVCFCGRPASGETCRHFLPFLLLLSIRIFFLCLFFENDD